MVWLHFRHGFAYTVYHFYHRCDYRTGDCSIIDTEDRYTAETVPITPFNREKSGIDNLLQYKSSYIGDNSNDGNLLSSLPLAEYGFVFEIDPDSRELTVDYHATYWYLNDNLYADKSLIYNSICIFLLIDNAESVTYNFSGDSWHITRDRLETYYPGYADIRSGSSSDEGSATDGGSTTGGINMEKFNQYVEQKINDSEFIAEQFDLLFES